eukprot:690750-Rhodomonas_salina.1
MRQLQLISGGELQVYVAVYWYGHSIGPRRWSGHAHRQYQPLGAAYAASAGLRAMRTVSTRVYSSERCAYGAMTHTISTSYAYGAMQNTSRGMCASYAAKGLEEVLRLCVPSVPQSVASYGYGHIRYRASIRGQRRS